jgi:hypothetical protein
MFKRALVLPDKEKSAIYDIIRDKHVRIKVLNQDN